MNKQTSLNILIQLRLNYRIFAECEQFRLFRFKARRVSFSAGRGASEYYSVFLTNYIDVPSTT